MENFRHSVGNQFEIKDQSDGIFSTTAYDSYMSFAYTYEQKHITNGRQLLGVVLFYVPRTVWKDKPVGSGATMATAYHITPNDFSNIAMNILGEGYINFGMPGVFIFLIALALFARRMDYLFWDKHNGDTNCYFAPYYLFELGMFFFILRGDMLCGTAFSVRQLFVVFVVSLIIKLDHRKYNSKCHSLTNFSQQAGLNKRI